VVKAATVCCPSVLDWVDRVDLVHVVRVEVVRRLARTRGDQEREQKQQKDDERGEDGEADKRLRAGRSACSGWTALRPARQPALRPRCRLGGRRLVVLEEIELDVVVGRVHAGAESNASAGKGVLLETK